jgi:hypothetical protein
MVFGGVDEGSIHVPEYCSIHDHDSPDEISVRISDDWIDAVKFNMGVRFSPNRFSYSSQGKLLEAMGIAIELANSFG